MTRCNGWRGRGRWSGFFWWWRWRWRRNWVRRRRWRSRRWGRFCRRRWRWRRRLLPPNVMMSFFAMPTMLCGVETTIVVGAMTIVSKVVNRLMYVFMDSGVLGWDVPSQGEGSGDEGESDECCESSHGRC